MDPEDPVDRLHRWRHARRVVDQHPVRVTVHRKKNLVTVQIPFPLTPPDTPPENSRTVDVTCTLTPGDLYLFATLPPLVFADVMTAYLAQAAREVFPSLSTPTAPKRREADTLLKWKAAGEAKRMYPTVQWLLKHPEMQNPWFTDLQAAVQRSRNGPPTASDITAWVIERLFAPEWEQADLTKPTRLADFAKGYIYSDRGRRARDYMPYDLEEMIRPLLL